MLTLEARLAAAWNPPDDDDVVTAPDDAQVEALVLATLTAAGGSPRSAAAVDHAHLAATPPLPWLPGRDQITRALDRLHARHQVARIGDAYVVVPAARLPRS